MKKILRIKSGITALLFLFAAGILYSQTAGTFSFSVTTTSTGGFSPEHLLAIWIENNATTFIKTKIRYAGQGDLDHLQTWVNKSNQNVVDATTGPTRTSHGTVTFLWNGTNVAGTVVPDGSYFVWLEMAWASSLTTGKTVNNYPFTKGTTAFHSTPANTANFLSLIIDWTPSSTPVEGVLDNKDIRAYPNPSSGIFSIDFKRPLEEGVLELINDGGKIVYNERLSGIPAGVKTFDLSALSDGIYYCRIRFQKEEIIFRVILVK
jgi:hypothetical protein